MKTTPENITSLKKGEVFVFGSNLAGIHGAGAAKLAHKRFGAEWGVGEGPTGRCYAIPTKDRSIQTLPLADIKNAVETFIRYADVWAIYRPGEVCFLVTKIGCGLAGYGAADIAPMFIKAPPNVIMPEEFVRYNAGR